jgi:TetR/AcrR family transcriptional regulator, cholesterol catabolism regulator
MGKIKTAKQVSKKEVIIQKAALLFIAKGFSAASMRDLAENIGVEAASLYNHIKSKNEILQEICFNVANRFTSHMDEVESKSISNIEKIETLLRYHTHQMIVNYEEVHVADREWKHLTDPYLSNFHNQRRLYRNRFANIIEHGIASGEMKNIDAPTAVLILLHAVNGIESWHRSASSKRLSGDEIENNIVNVLLGGLKK